jgi:hypothetical protein
MSQAALLSGPVKSAPMLQRCNLILCDRHKQTSAEQHIHLSWSVHDCMAGSRPRRPQQSQTGNSGGLLSKRFELLNAWQQIGLLFLNEHRPLDALLQTAQSAMTFTAGQKDSAETASGQAK